jgi:uncharacterized protein
MMVERNQTERVLEAFRDTPAVLIAGPRQVGKSTLAHQLGRNVGAASIVTLDDLPTRGAATRDPGGFVRGLSLPAVIDELQRAPDLLYGIKQAIDERRLAGARAAGSFLLTGSSGIWDTLAAPESLAGRIEHVRLWPFSQGELAGRRERFVDSLFAGAPPELAGAPAGREPIAKAVVIGGFPEVQERSEERAQRWFAEYLARVLDRDIRELSDVRRAEDLLALLRVCATRAGGLVNVDGMLADLGIPRSTGRRYYELLKQTYLVQEIPAWGANLARAAVRRPKLVLCDSGLTAHLLGQSTAKFVGDLDVRPGAGNLYESFVIVELLKAASWADTDVTPFHWRDRSGREVDLLLERRDGDVAALECKLSTSVGEHDFRHLAHLRDRLGDRFRGGAIVYTGANTLPFGDRLWAVPVSGLWS